MTIPDGYAKNVAIIDLDKQEAQVIPVISSGETMILIRNSGLEVMVSLPKFSGRIFLLL